MKFGQVTNLDSIEFDLPEIPNRTKELLNKSTTEKSVKFYFGAPGWSDINYKGNIYPRKTSSAKMLIEYAKQFNSIEFNGTRYGVPKLTTAEKWKDKVNKDFKFSMKLPQFITHRKNINDIESYQKIDEFLLLWDNIVHYSGVNFAVMANYFRSDKFNDLAKFVQYWPKEVPLAIELRDQSWFNLKMSQSWHELFYENRIIPVITDTPGRRDVLHFNLTNDHLFVRYVGDFSHESDKKRIEQWVNRISELVGMGVNHIWFYVHQPGENRERILQFYNYMLPLINTSLDLNIPLLVDYSKA